MPPSLPPIGRRVRPGSDLVTFTVRVDGNAIDGEIQVLDVQVDHALDVLPRAVLTVGDGDASTEDFPISSSSTFTPGTAVEVLLGRGGRETTAFTGIVLAQRIRADATNGSTLEVVCGDRAARMAVAPTSRQLTDMSDDQVIASIVEAAGLEAVVEPTSVDHELRVQHRATDWDFVRGLARANGMVVSVDDATVTVGPPRFDRAVVKLAWGDSILDLDLELDAATQLAGVTASAWDPVTQSVVTMSASEPTVNRQGRLSGVALADVLDVSAELQAAASTPPDHLRAVADATLQASRLARVCGTVTMDGSTKVTPGDLVDLAGLGSVFSGAGYVTGVHHDVDSGQWRTLLTFGMAARPADPTTRGAGLRPAVTGLAVATVLATVAGPGAGWRVQVAVPPLADPRWVRHALPWASDGAGTSWLPEVGDEVVVGFLDGDPDAGVLLGAMHSAARPGPVTAGEEATRVIVTPAGLRLAFDDDARAVQVATPAGRVLTLDDDAGRVVVADAGGSSITMEGGGIQLAAAADLTIQAGGVLHISGDGGLVLHSTDDVAVTGGSDVSVRGEQSAAIASGASTTVTSSGQTVVEGSIVRIN